MEKKPKLLDRNYVIVSCNSDLNFKIIEQITKGLGNIELIVESNFIKFLSAIFIKEPKFIILGHEPVSESVKFAKHIRNNQRFEKLPIVCISNSNQDIKKAKLYSSKLNIDYYSIPINTNEIIKVIKSFIEG